jgi:hypothetical protein
MDLKKSKVQSKLSNRQELLFNRLKIFYNSHNINELLHILNGETKLSLRIIDWFVTNYTKKNNIILYNKKKKMVTHKSPKNKLESKTKKAKYEYVDEQFNIFLNYKGQLKAYSKKNFDPFCRRERLNFYYNNDNYITTTVGQLNFFKWAIENNVLKYINDNLDKIDIDMNINIKRDEDKCKKSKKTGRKKKNTIIDLKKVNLDTIDKKPQSVPLNDKYGLDTHSDNNDNNNINDGESKKRRKRRELSCSANNSLNKHKFSITLEFG